MFENLSDFTPEVDVFVAAWFVKSSHSLSLDNLLSEIFKKKELWSIKEYIVHVINNYKTVLI